MAPTTCLCSERGGLGPALLGKSVLVSDQGVGGVHVAAVDTGLGARRGQAAGKPPRGPHRVDTTWGILGGWLSASRAHGCLCGRGLLSQDTPQAVAVLMWLGSVQQNTHCLWDTVPGQPPDPRGETPTSAPSGQPRAHHQPAGSPRRRDQEPDLPGQGHVRAGTANSRTRLVTAAATSGRTGSRGAGGRSRHQTSTKRHSCRSSAGTEAPRRGPGAGAAPSQGGCGAGWRAPERGAGCGVRGAGCGVRG